MAETMVTGSAIQSERNPDPELLDSVVAGLERRRRRAIVAYWGTVFALLACLPLLAAPFLLLAWLGTHPAPGSVSAGLVSQARAWMEPYKDWVGPVLFCWPVVGLLAMAWAYRRFAMRPRDAFVGDCKRQVFTAVCRHYFPEIVYEPGEGVHWQLFDGSGLFPFASDEYWSEDRFTGRWDATEVCFAEANAERKRRRWTNEGFRTVYETYFSGIVFIADFHKHFRSTTRLLPKGAKVASAPGEKRVTLEDPVFESAFQTWSTDQVDVRYILSTNMISRFNALNSRFPGLRVRFHNERLLLLLPGRRDRFEPSLYRRTGSRAQIEAFIGDVRAFLSVVDDLNLNTRIWSKD